jgi:hypothetical protein
MTAAARMIQHYATRGEERGNGPLIVIKPSGQRLALTPTQARELAAHLIRCANTIEGTP